MARPRGARAQDVRDAALAMPYVTVEWAQDNPVYQVGGKSFVFLRNPRKDAVDPRTGERYDDVIVIWVGGEDEKQALPGSGHPVLHHAALRWTPLGAGAREPPRRGGV